MRDFPMFTTENGIATLILREIPTKQTAYIHLQSSQEPEKLLSECVEFCQAAGAEKIYATGHACLEKYPLFTTIISMRGNAEGVGATELCLFPVTDMTWAEFCKVYNEKMASVPTANTLRLMDREKYEKGAYFVHKEGILQGIGIVEDNRILAIAACQKGSGREILAALCKVLPDDIILDVAENNLPAVKLYTRCGFLKTAELARWYEIL